MSHSPFRTGIAWNIFFVSHEGCLFDVSVSYCNLQVSALNVTNAYTFPSSYCFNMWLGLRHPPRLITSEATSQEKRDEPSAFATMNTGEPNWLERYSIIPFSSILFTQPSIACLACESVLYGVYPRALCPAVTGMVPLEACISPILLERAKYWFVFWAKIEKVVCVSQTWNLDFKMRLPMLVPSLFAFQRTGAYLALQLSSLVLKMRL